MRPSTFLLCGLLLSTVLLACPGEEPKVCVPGKSEACVGPGGCSGGQRCNASGTGFEACECASVIEDAGPSGTDAGPTDGGPVDGGGGDGGVSACNLVTNTGCNSGERCGWVQPTMSDGGARCVPFGDAGLMASCTYGSEGYDNCAGALICLGNKCLPPCEPSPGTCPQHFACQRYSFDDGAAGQEVGVCTPTCDPLSQQRNFDSAPACGSTNSTSPELGCYGAPDRSFSCQRVIDPNKKHRDPAAASGSTVAYLNSCAPGYLPLLKRSSTSSEVVCIALCRPAESFLGSSAQVQGVTPYSCPERGATAATEECRYWWMLESASTNTEHSNTLGFCFDPSQYTYDHDKNATTPEIAQPSCTTLANTDTDLDGTPDHRAWACAPRP
ncbi:MAG: hypothetical protein ACOZIN_04105 [Myxococcota bacterium]